MACFTTLDRSNPVYCPSNACVRVCTCVCMCRRAGSCLSFFSLIPQSAILHGRVLFLTGGGPQPRTFFPLSPFSPSSCFSFLFSPFSPFLSLLFLFFPFFLQVHPLSPVSLSHRCPIHPPQTGVATCSALFHLIRGHKLLPRSLYTGTRKKKEKENSKRKRESPTLLFFRLRVLSRVLLFILFLLE